MDVSLVERALELVGNELSHHEEVEVLVVGGAAGMLTGVFAASRTTLDCDIMDYAPEGAMVAVERAAERVAGAIGMPPTWLNSHVQIRRDALPEGWRSRRVWVGAWGRLRVFAASRVDLIAMKVLAGRVQDLEDLGAMQPRADEVEFVRRHLDGLSGKGTSPEEIAGARALLKAMQGGDHG